MKKLLILLIMLMMCVQMDAQKGSHSVSIDYQMYQSGSKFFKDDNKKHSELLIGAGYQYGLSDRFKIAPEASVCVYNGDEAIHKLNFAAGIDLQTMLLRDDSDKQEVEVYLITGATYSGLKEKKSFSKQIGGRLGFGIMLYFNSHFAIRTEGAYNTYEKLDIRLGTVYRF